MSPLPFPLAPRTSHARVADCACPDGGPGSAAGLSRRTLLKGLGAGALTLMATETTHAQVAFASSTYTGDVMVVLSLRGGMDGLSAVVPHGYTEYYSLRPTISVPVGQVIGQGVSTGFGLHPAMNPLLPLWTSGKLAAIHGVGHPGATRSHFHAMEELERAAPGTSVRTGWLDRALGGRDVPTARELTFQTVSLTGAQTPMMLAGPSPELTLGSVDSFKLGVEGFNDPTIRARTLAAYQALHAAGTGPSTVTDTGTAAISAIDTLSDSGPLAAVAPGAGYPDTELGRTLSEVARLIKAGVGVQVATIDNGDWDMHAGMGSSSGGWMHKKLTELATAMAAFYSDLGATRMAGVTLLTISEFGRRADENGSGGVDHGNGNLMLALGGGIRGGVRGRFPGLASSQLDNGAVASVTDYRDVIGQALQKRCGAGSLSNVFPNFSASSTDLGVFVQRT